MPFAAGQRLTAGALNAITASGAALSTDTASAISTYEQWGTETITFTNPGRAVRIIAKLTGQFQNAVDASTNGGVRVGVSLDGGSTWTYGNAPATNVGTADGVRQIVAADNYVTGTPTGNVVVRAEFNVSDTSISAMNGYITAQMTPA